MSSINGINGPATIVADGGIAISTTPNTITISNVDDIIRSYQLEGSSVIAQPVGYNIALISQSSGIGSGEIRGNAVYIGKAATLTGVKMFTVTAGIYTANNFNGLGLYSYSNGVCTLVATSGNLPNFWKGTPGALMTIPFTAPYAATPGLYFIGLQYSSSTETKAPRLGGIQAFATPLDFTNSAKIVFTLTGQTTQPTSFNMSDAGISGRMYWLGVY